MELYNLLRDQFDRVVYLLSKTFEIQCSAGFWQSALKQFLANNGYCYPWLTEANLPYIFAYKGMQQKDVYGQKVKKGSELYEALSNVPNVLLKDAPNEKYAVILKKGDFLQLHFRLFNHTQQATEGTELTESINFCIDDFSSGKTVFQTKVMFDETHFLNLIGKEENEDKRQKRFLNIANNLMEPLKPTPK